MIYALVHEWDKDIDALLRELDIPPEELLARYAAPGTLDYWQSLTPSQLEPLRGLTPANDTLPVGVNTVNVALIHKSIIPGPNISFDLPASAFATVRFFPDLEQWRVERLGDLGPPQPERLN